MVVPRVACPCLTVRTGVGSEGAVVADRVVVGQTFDIPTDGAFAVVEHTNVGVLVGHELGVRRGLSTYFVTSPLSFQIGNLFETPTKIGS